MAFEHVGKRSPFCAGAGEGVTVQPFRNKKTFPRLCLQHLLEPLKCCFNCRRAFLPVHYHSMVAVYVCPCALNIQVQALTVRLCVSFFSFFFLKAGLASLLNPHPRIKLSCLLLFFSDWCVRNESILKMWFIFFFQLYIFCI